MRRNNFVVLKKQPMKGILLISITAGSFLVPPIIPWNYGKTQMGFEAVNLNVTPGIYYLSVVYSDGTTITKSILITD